MNCNCSNSFYSQDRWSFIILSIIMALILFLTISMSLQLLLLGWIASKIKSWTFVDPKSLQENRTIPFPRPSSSDYHLGPMRGRNSFLVQFGSNLDNDDEPSRSLWNPPFRNASICQTFSANYPQPPPSAGEGFSPKRNADDENALEATAMYERGCNLQMRPLARDRLQSRGVAHQSTNNSGQTFEGHLSSIYEILDPNACHDEKANLGKQERIDAF